MKRTTRLFRNRAVKTGLPPGALVHIGETPPAGTGITLLRFDEGSFQETRLPPQPDCATLAEGSGVTWINVEGLHDVEAIRTVGECRHLHPLVLEDIVSTVQRPKVEDYGEYLFLVMRLLRPQPENDFSSEQFSLVLGRTWLLTFQEGLSGDAFSTIRDRLRHGTGRLRSQGADYLAYGLLDAIVDHYFTVLEGFGERLLDLEEVVALHPTPQVLVQLNELKKEVIYLRKSVWPLREVLSFLERGDNDLITAPTRVYLRDVYDHTIQAIDTIETYRDLLSGMLDLYLYSISNRTNELMKFLTLVGTVFLPLTFIVGLYGMNFKDMPELQWQHGYLYVWLVMIALALGMVAYFRRKRWL